MIDYVLEHKDNVDKLSDMCVCDFNECSDHAPIALTRNCLQFDAFHGTQDNITVSTVYRWDAYNLDQKKLELNTRLENCTNVLMNCSQQNRV